MVVFHLAKARKVMEKLLNGTDGYSNREKLYSLESRMAAHGPR